jgi:CHAT domain-containing protein
MRGHRYIHLSTHGFFGPPELTERPAGPVDPSSVWTSPQRVTLRYPDLLAAIALAGSNRPARPGFDDGILTAAEVQQIDLRGTDLVVLSACETAIGSPTRGEGMIGLHRAFHIAGARHVVASLWPVHDDATTALMRVFYHKLWAEAKPPIVALREAQLALYRHPERIGTLARVRGPDFAKEVPLVEAPDLGSSQARAPIRLWAGFVLSGAGDLSAPGRDSGPAERSARPGLAKDSGTRPEAVNHDN